MFEGIRYCKEIIEQQFKKELTMSKENETYFRKDSKYHICNKVYSEKDIRVKDHCNNISYSARNI